VSAHCEECYEGQRVIGRSCACPCHGSQHDIAAEEAYWREQEAEYYAWMEAEMNASVGAQEEGTSGGDQG